MHLWNGMRRVLGETEEWEGDREVYAPLEWNETCVGRD